jgi:hypothetical protein
MFVDQYNHWDGTDDRPVRFDMSPETHDPEKGDYADNERIQSSVKYFMRLVFNENVNSGGKRERIEYSQLVREIFEKIAPSETSASVAQVIFETREIHGYLPVDMWKEQHDSENSGEPELVARQYPEIGQQYESDDKDCMVFAVYHPRHGNGKYERVQPRLVSKKFPVCK